MAKFQIFVPSSYAFLVQCDDRDVINWRELMNEARQAVEPELREHWQRYRQLLELSTKQALAKDATLDEVMAYTCTPGMYYPCPEWLAAKARVEEG